MVLLWLTTHVTIQHWQTAIASLLAIMTLTLVATGTTRPIRPMIKTGFSLLTSVALWALAGYGYRPGRAILAWALVVLAGTIAFYAADRGVGWHGVWGALIESISACHGRGVFYLVKGQTSASFAQGTIASILAVCGLIIEATFIATFTQRFFGR